MADVKILVGFDGDSESWWWTVDHIDGDDDDPYRHVLEVDGQLVERLTAANDEYEAALKAVVTAGGLSDDGRSAKPCERFTYDPPAVHRWWRTVLSASDGTEWPVIDAEVGPHYDTPEDAQAAIDAFPDSFFVHHTMGLVEVTRDRFFVSDKYEIGGPSKYAMCERCDYTEDEHGQEPSDG